MADKDPEEAARLAAIEQWKIKKLIKNLDAARGNGTSMISLVIPPKDQVARVNKMLGDEYGTASNIKSRVNRLSVLSAITSTQQRLKLYNKVPTNGLVLYCGTVLTDEGKEKQVTIDFEPFKPINTSLYLCDNKFHVEALKELLETDDKFGFIIMDGNGCLFANLAGNTREILHKMSVELPKKHGRGGQSALRFARLRLEKRHNYVTKVAEMCAQVFITNDKVNVTGLVVAGSAEFKNVLVDAERFDQRLAAKVLTIVDVSYGGENGLNQAIELSAEVLSNVKFVQEKKVIKKYFDEISQDTGKICFGMDDTLKCLEAGAVDTLVVWEQLDIIRYVLKSTAPDSVEEVLTLTPAQSKDSKHFRDEENNCEKEVLEKMELVEWFSTNYQKFGCKLEFVSNKSQEGSQFCKGFGGVGGFLRYRCDFLEVDVFEGMDEEGAKKMDFSDDDFDDDDLDLDDFM
jgi:peptide chain release factor subunit 1